MCKPVSAQGSLGAPCQSSIRTGIDTCQRSGVFINGSDDDLTVISGGMQFVVPPYKTATMPIGQDLGFIGRGSGAIQWTVTDAVLPASLSDAPAPAAKPNVVCKSYEAGVLLLSGGTYTKLTIVPEGGAGG